MLDDGLKGELKYTSSMFRIILLSLPSVSTKNLLNYIVRNILNSLTVRIKSIVSFGIEIRIFTEVNASVADYLWCLLH